MIIRTLACTAAAVTLAGAVPAPGPARAATPGVAPGAAPAPGLPEALSGRERDALALIEAHVFGTLPPRERALILAAGAYAPPADRPYERLAPLGDAEYQTVRRVLTREAFGRLRPVHQHGLVAMMEAQAEGRPVPVMCFGPGTPDDVRLAFERAQNGPFGARFQQGNRWSTTASGSAGARGNRITLRYSFVPDGTSVPNLSGTLQTSNLFATLNGVYGTPAVWQALYAQVFARWGALIGVTYVLEPNDDGAAIDPNGTQNPGVVGVRGDCRFSGTALDGPSNVLAFNYFPSSGVGGDMVLDTSDTFFTGSGATSANSIRLRNVLAHEHGHGLGFAHVCPINTTKLMEPFYTGNFDGPQFDDILNGQRFYGDASEPNNSAAAATPVAGAVMTNLSLDGPADQDWFAIPVTAGTTLTVTATPPANTPYASGPQNSNGSCSAGTSFDARTINPLAVEIRSGASGGTVVAASAPVNAGAAAAASYIVTQSGTLFARVFTPGTTDNIQAYTLSAAASSQPAILLSLPQPAPTLLSPAGPTVFNVQIGVANDTLASARVFYRPSSAAAYQSGDLQPTATPGVYAASIPAMPCGATPEFYVAASGVLAPQATLPAAAPTARYTATVGAVAEAFVDDFSTDKGWTYGFAGDTATTGVWLRGTPIGTTSNGTQAQPGAGFSPPQCAFTGQGTPGSTNAGEADVDGGFTTLVSPRIDLSQGTNQLITYRRWYSNNLGQNAGTNTFTVDISADDGQTWVNAETVGPSGAQAQGGWYQGAISIAALVTPSATIRVRFVAADLTGALVEAAVDDVRATALTCSQPAAACRADYNGRAGVELTDIFDFLADWFAGNARADFDGLNGVDLTDIFGFLGAWFTGCP